MEATKRKYVKKSNEGKITVKHYLNTRLKPVPNEKSFRDETKRYPIYVRCVLLGKTFDMKSRITIPAAEDEFNSTLTSEKDFFDNEIKEISEIIRALNPFNNISFNFKEVINRYNFLFLTIQSAIENSLKEKVMQLIETGLKKNFEDKNKIGRFLEQTYGEFYEPISQPIELGFKENGINYDNEKVSEQIVSNFEDSTFNGLLMSYKLKEYSYLLIEEMTANNSAIFKKAYTNYEDFAVLKNRFNLLWIFWGDYYPKILIKNKRTRILTNEWFSSNFIQEAILEIFPEEGIQLINQINDLLDFKTL